ncbi:hypothetical protein [Parasitella parasitica]|uniref:Anaphase-promoting complex subunit 5 n=1 Tax=Parasitella parasitica TaxID=35722 RepID=A0A0B7NU52_9FUNG|nr:hypothetical protein [Parasitella parasitica]
MTRRKSSPLIPTVHACEPQVAMKHPTSYVAATTTIDDIDLAKQPISQDQDGEYDQFDNMDTCCGCGIILAKGWACDNCRISCPGCNRSLANDPLEYCSRCNSQCQKHGLYKNVDFKSCPSCLTRLTTTETSYLHYKEYFGKFMHRYWSKEVKAKIDMCQNEEHIRNTCSEPLLKDILSEISSWSNKGYIIEPTLQDLELKLNSIKTQHALNEFIDTLKSLLDAESEDERDKLKIEKTSVMGLFVRKCRIEYSTLPFDQLEHIFQAYQQYLNGIAGDTDFEVPNKSTHWISDYNVAEFLRHQAQTIEQTGTTNISPPVLHAYLDNFEKQIPSINIIRQVRYLNYTRTREYIQSLSHLHFSIDMSLDKGVNVQYALLHLGIMEYKFGHSFNALSALNDALSAARSNKDELCLQEVQFWIEVCRKNHPFNEFSSYTDDYLNNLKTLTRARNLLRNGEPCRYVFELLYKSMIHIIMNDIKHMDRAQFLTTSLTWQRYGNSVLAKSFLDLAKTSQDESIDDIEKTIITEANMLQTSGDSDQAINVIDLFTERYRSESDFLMGWRQTKARIIRQMERKRKFGLIEYQNDLLQATIPPDSEEYFIACHDHAYHLMLKKEFERALLVLDEVHDFIRKTDRTSQLGNNLILQATIHLKLNSPSTAIPHLIQAIKIAKNSVDAQNYYCATIKLAESYLRLNQSAAVKKSIFMLESIFPKVLVMKSKHLESNLYLTYAKALDAQYSSQTEHAVLEYVEKAEQGFRDLKLVEELLTVLHFKSLMLEKLKMTLEKHKTLNEIRNLQQQKEIILTK